MRVRVYMRERLLIGRGVLLLDEEIRGRIEREGSGARIGDVTQHNGEVCVIVFSDGHGTECPGGGRSPRLTLVPCLGVPNTGQCKTTAGNRTVPDR